MILISSSKFKWELVPCLNGQYTIKSVPYQKFAGSSWSGHPDGEFVQSSDTQQVWKIEDGSGDQYRYVDLLPFRDVNSGDTVGSVTSPQGPIGASHARRIRLL